MLDKLLQALKQAQAEAKTQSPYLKEFREEQRVLPSVAGLPRIIRAFVRS